MQFYKQFSSGISQFFKAFNFIFSNRLWYYYFIPLVLKILVFVSGIFLTSQFIDVATAWISNLLGVQEAQAFSIPEAGFWEILNYFWDFFLNMLSGAAEYIVAGIVWMAMTYVLAKVSKYIMLIILSPVLAFLSEKTEEILTGNEYPFEIDQFVRDIWRGIVIALRNFFLEMSIIILVWGFNLILATFIPPLGVFTSLISPFVLFFVGAYFYGFSMIDYALERKRMKVKESAQTVKKHRGIALGNGTMYDLFWSWIPFVGSAIAPINGIVGATLAMHNTIGLGDNPFANKKNDQLS